MRSLRSAANRAVQQIGSAISHNGLKDSCWDRNFGWISTVFKIIAIVVVVLAVVALLLAMPWIAAFIAGMLSLLGSEVTVATVAATLSTVSTALGWTLVGVTAVQAAYDGTAAATGKESWTAFALDLVALVTFSFGKVAEAGTKTLAENATDSAKAAAAGRAGRQAMTALGLPGFLFSLGSRFSLAAKVMRIAPAGHPGRAACSACHSPQPLPSRSPARCYHCSTPSRDRYGGSHDRVRASSGCRGRPGPGLDPRT